MPSNGEKQIPAGVKLSCGCETSCSCRIPNSKTMMPYFKNFKMEGPVYKGNAVLNAQKG